MSILYDMRSGELVKSKLFSNGLLLKDALKFTPMTLFTGGKQGAWYDPSDKSTLFQDVVGTVPVTKDGDPVALMKDKSGNGNHATQTVSTSRPLYKTDGILHWLTFDGVDDFLTAGNVMNLGLNGLMQVHSYQSNTIVVLGGKSMAAGLASRYFLGISNNSFLSSDSVETNLNGTFEGSTPKIATQVVTRGSASEHKLRINAVQVGAVASGISSTNVFTQGDTQFSIGAYLKGVGSRYSLPHSGKWFGCVVLIADSSNDTISQTEQYLAAKAGVTL